MESKYISTHAPAGGATGSGYLYDTAAYISTHAPAGGATKFYTAVMRGEVKISTHAPAGGATRANLESYCKRIISTHAPAGGATLARIDSERTLFYFYSRPCGRGDFMMPSLVDGCAVISTHAPAGGATFHRYSIMRRFKISTHAPAGGATLRIGAVGREDVISTHAPAGGATRYGRNTSQGSEFLLTPLREGRQRRQAMHGGYANFYSRPCGRGDASSAYIEITQSISTHAPAGGATPPSRISRSYRRSFLLTPLREGRPPMPLPPGRCGIFLLTPLREGRRGRRRKRKPRRSLFLLTPLREGRPASVCVILPSASFLLTPLREGRLERADWKRG